MLETLGAIPDPIAIEAWRDEVARLRAHLDWADGPIVARVHASGASLALAAPVDQLFTATEINEFAWARLAGHTTLMQHAPGHAAAWDDESARQTIRAMSNAEHDDRLAALVAESQRRGIGVLIDDDLVSIGSGSGVRSWPMLALPRITEIEWQAVHDIPLALVTGSNGKTSCVRLLAAIERAHGWHAAHSCTDGLYIDGESIAAGDYSGPAGARTVLRDVRAQAAVLETARGGILRRGIAPQHARTAIVTNISDDHFGEYGIHSLDDLGTVKLAVARALDADGLLVLNADDAVLRERARSVDVPIGWFSLDDGHALLRQHRTLGGATCALRDGRLWLAEGDASHDLGAVADMPLTFGGRAAYNIANVAAVSLAAHALGIAPHTIATASLLETVDRVS
ncbi:MAG: Mur ligase family protein, partial [Dokdonella sp.]